MSQEINRRRFMTEFALGTSIAILSGTTGYGIGVRREHALLGNEIREAFKDKIQLPLVSVTKVKQNPKSYQNSIIVTSGFVKEIKRDESVENVTSVSYEMYGSADYSDTALPLLHTFVTFLEDSNPLEGFVHVMGIVSQIDPNNPESPYMLHAIKAVAVVNSFTQDNP